VVKADGEKEFRGRLGMKLGWEMTVRALCGPLGLLICLHGDFIISPLVGGKWKEMRQY